MKPANITQLLATYIHALHILHYHGVLDGYGHLSVRNPDNPATFFTIYQMAPALVSGLDDIGEYRVSDSERARPGNPDAKDTVERFIHGETLKRYPDVNVVLHGHAEEMVAYSISRVPLRAATHMSPFLGEEVPNFDITKFYRPNDTQDFLVRNQRLGAALAAEFDVDDSPSDFTDNDTRGGGGHFASRPETSSNSNTYPRHNVVLMRSHGFAAVATDVKMATYEGIFALTNAKIEASALMLQHAYTGQAAQGRDGIAYLTPRQIYDSWQTERGIVDKPWALWVREVQVNPLYVNELDPDQ